MTFGLKIIDEAPGGPRRFVREMRLVSERITMRELMQRRIEDEVAEINAGLKEPFPLVVPTMWEQRLNGRTGKPPAVRGSHERVDAGKQLAAAIEAFGKGRIVVIVGDRQVSDLDAPLTLTPGTEVTFLKLVPLVGG
jgi:hypothetical protein